MTAPLPPFSPVAQGVQLSMKMTQGGQEAVVVLGGLLAFSEALTKAAADQWLLNAWGNLKQRMSGEVNLTGGTVRDLRTQGAAVIECALPTGTVGADPGALAFAGACALAKYTSTGPGRRGRGRSFLPGVTEGDISLGGRLLSATGQATWQSNVAAYISAQTAATGGIKPAVLSRRQGQAYVITGSGVASVLGVQRRRLR